MKRKSVVFLLFLLLHAGCSSGPSQMWGSKKNGGNKQFFCKVVGTSDGQPMVACLLNTNVTLSGQFSFRLVTSEWPRSVYVNGEKVRPPADGMYLFINHRSNAVSKLEVKESGAVKAFVRGADFSQECLRDLWKTHAGR